MRALLLVNQQVHREVSVEIDQQAGPSAPIFSRRSS
jgi:hypothetical protein